MSEAYWEMRARRAFANAFERKPMTDHGTETQPDEAVAGQGSGEARPPLSERMCLSLEGVEPFSLRLMLEQDMNEVARLEARNRHLEQVARNLERGAASFEVTGTNTPATGSAWVRVEDLEALRAALDIHRSEGEEVAELQAEGRYIDALIVRALRERIEAKLNPSPPPESEGER